MSAARIAVACCALARVALACSTFSGADDSTPSPATDAGDASDAVATNDAGGGGEDALAIDATKDAGDESGVVFEDRFEATSNGPCSGWTQSLGTSVILQAGGRTGNACRVCSTADGGNGVLTKIVPTTEKANWSTLAYVRQDPMNPTIKGWGLTTAWNYTQDGGAVALDNRAYTPGSLGNSYSLAQSSTPFPVAPLSEIHIRVSTLGDNGQCFLLDDVQLFKTP